MSIHSVLPTGRAGWHQMNNFWNFARPVWELVLAGRLGILGRG